MCNYSGNFFVVMEMLPAMYILYLSPYFPSLLPSPLPLPLPLSLLPPSPLFEALPHSSALFQQHSLFVWVVEAPSLLDVLIILRLKREQPLKS